MAKPSKPLKGQLTMHQLGVDPPAEARNPIKATDPVAAAMARTDAHTDAQPQPRYDDIKHAEPHSGLQVHHAAGKIQEAKLVEIQGKHVIVRVGDYLSHELWKIPLFDMSPIRKAAIVVGKPFWYISHVTLVSLRKAYYLKRRNKWTSDPS